MQTFLPYPNFEKSLLILDTKRLLKQRVESSQILTIIDPHFYKYWTHRKQNPVSKAWKNHPAVLMWTGSKENPTMYSDALALYYNYSIAIAEYKGYPPSEKLPYIKLKKSIVCLPPWFGDDDFHRSHKSNLLRKDYEYYSQFEGFENVPDNLDYIWVYDTEAYIKRYLIFNNIIDPF
jgi:hypothetical protein